MKIQIALAAITAALLLPSAATQVRAQEQVVETIVCQSTVGTRATCQVNGEIISAGIQRQVGDGSPCFLNYTWGFAENGIWTGNRCSAEFEVTVERAAAQPITDPEVLRSRLRQSRLDLRDARLEITQKKESRRLLKAELTEVQAALREADAAAPNGTKSKRKPLMAIRSVAVCSNKAVREAKKSGVSSARVSEIIMARPTQGTWLVVGRVSTKTNQGRSSNYFRCRSEQGKIVSYDNTM